MKASVFLRAALRDGAGREVHIRLPFETLSAQAAPSECLVVATAVHRENPAALTPGRCAARIQNP